MKQRFLLFLLILMNLPAVARAQEMAEPGYWEPTLLPHTGLATFYAPGLMEYVHDYRQGQGQIVGCPECVGSVALLRAGDIGRKVWLQPPGGEAVGPFLVVDCARREDVAPLQARNWAVDVSYEVGQLWGMVRPLDGVTVLEDPADIMAGPLRAPTAFFVPAEQAVISVPTATPEVVVPGPTPWPTRLPVGVYTMPAASRATPAPLPTFGPPPLTPIVTTPTPAATPGPAAAAPAPVTVSPARTAPVEISLGRAGTGLLAPAVNRTDPTVVATPTPKPSRTPRPDLTPILPAPAPPDTSPAEPPAPPLVRLWRTLITLVLR